MSSTSEFSTYEAPGSETIEFESDPDSSDDILDTSEQDDDSGNGNDSSGFELSSSEVSKPAKKTSKTAKKSPAKKPVKTPAKTPVKGKKVTFTQPSDSDEEPIVKKKSVANKKKVASESEDEPIIKKSTKKKVVSDSDSGSEDDFSSDELVIVSSKSSRKKTTSPKKPSSTTKKTAAKKKSTPRDDFDLLESVETEAPTRKKAGVTRANLLTRSSKNWKKGGRNPYKLVTANNALFQTLITGDVQKAFMVAGDLYDAGTLGQEDLYRTISRMWALYATLTEPEKTLAALDQLEDSLEYSSKKDKRPKTEQANFAMGLTLLAEVLACPKTPYLFKLWHIYSTNTGKKINGFQYINPIDELRRLTELSKSNRKDRELIADGQAFIKGHISKEDADLGRSNVLFYYYLMKREYAAIYWLSEILYYSSWGEIPSRKGRSGLRRPEMIVEDIFNAVLSEKMTKLYFSFYWENKPPHKSAKIDRASFRHHQSYVFPLALTGYYLLYGDEKIREFKLSNLSAHSKDLAAGWLKKIVDGNYTLIYKNADIDGVRVDEVFNQDSDFDIADVDKVYKKVPVETKPKRVVTRKTKGGAKKGGKKGGKKADSDNDDDGNSSDGDWESYSDDE